MSTPTRGQAFSVVKVCFKPDMSYSLASSSGAYPNRAVRNLIKVGNPYLNAPECHPVHGKKDYKAVYSAQMYSTSIFGEDSDSAPIDVAVKWSTGALGIDMLLQEVGFYENPLKSEQGISVPKFYGFYVGRVDDVEVGCLLTEWCGGEPHPDLWERNRQKLFVAARIHNVRVCHGRLSGDDDHYAASSKDNTMRIVNFSHASLHNCPGGTPLMLNPDNSEDTPEKCSRCPELALLEETYGPDTGMDSYRVRQANGLRHSSWLDGWMSR